MALETMKGLTEIRGEMVKEILSPVDNFDQLAPIRVNHDRNEITFRIQNGPVKENGKNGCQLDSMIAVAMHMITKLNEKYPHPNNDNAIGFLGKALNELDIRTKDREDRGVEGTSQA
jgi:hypothetical protein